MSEADSLFDFYSRQEILPTFGDFKTQEALDRQARYRRNLYEEKLHLPIALFKGAKVVEFGPDSGENALVCAQWGAQLSLVEPNPKALDPIRAYFTQFGLNEHLDGLYPTDMASFAKVHASQGPFDFVIAEGFLHAVRPDRVWIDVIKTLLAPDGFAVVFTHDPAGMFTDQLLKAIQVRVRELTGLGSVPAAKMVFQAKWDAIPHIRPLEAWVMDQLENPFIRLHSCHDPIQLGRTLAEGGLRTVSSWPPMVDNMDMYWHKTVLGENALLENQERFYRHNRLSYMLGRPLFCGMPAPDDLVDGIFEALDALIDRFVPETAMQLRTGLELLEVHLQREAAPMRRQDLTHALAFLASIQTILALMIGGDAEQLATFCQGDEAFIKNWGLPVHFRVLRHRANA